MNQLDPIVATGIVITLAAIFAYANERWLQFPETIGLMVVAMIITLLLVLVGVLNPRMVELAREFVEQIDFNATLMHGMLGFLLFAGALHVKLNDLAEQKWVVTITATFGVIGSTLLVGILAHYILLALGISMSWINCLLFGALISPTDPISVLGIMKKIGAPKSLATKISGESLFNDGVGVVVFLVILGAATGASDVTVSQVGLLLLQEVGGGVLLGLLLGGIAFYLHRTVESVHVELLISLAVVAGGYPLALALHCSGPIAMVVAGLLIGNPGRRHAMGEKVRVQVDALWEMIDEVLNAILFVLLGLEVIVLAWRQEFLFAGFMMIPVVLFSRFVTIGAAVTALRRFRVFSPRVIRILTWGGLRGGISVALALSIPMTLVATDQTQTFPARNLILVMTYVVVVFSIVVQGLTIGPYIRRSLSIPTES
ncbi:MAG: sodium:proton antiporter [Pirellulales bacterium]|jgi:monovalent cation:H+ antiporter, CPA1 family|nr:sodium:proton antiporter [Pirellulales bacterium]